MDTHTPLPRPPSIPSHHRRIIGWMLVGILAVITFGIMGKPPRPVSFNSTLDPVMPGWEYELIASKPDSADSLNFQFLVRHPLTKRVTILTHPRSACDTIPWMRPRTLVLYEVVPFDFLNWTAPVFRVEFNPIRLDQILPMPNYYRHVPRPGMNTTHWQRANGTENDHA